MRTFTRFAMYDAKRDRFTNEEEYLNDGEADVEALASSDFSETINRLSKDWENRKTGRYHLFRLGTVRGDGSYISQNIHRVMTDEEVLFDPDIYRWKDPPYDDASEAAYQAAVARIQAAEAVARAEREARRGQNFFISDDASDAA